jgi:putative flippase GtrA
MTERGEFLKMPLLSARVELGRLARFASVGVLATLVYFAVALIAANAIGLAPISASISGQIASTAVSYFGHASFSFRVQPRHGVFLPRFLTIAALTFAMNFGVSALLTTLVGAPSLLVFCAMALLIPTTNYLCNRFWVFLPGLHTENTTNEETLRSK